MSFRAITGLLSHGGGAPWNIGVSIPHDTLVFMLGDEVDMTEMPRNPYITGGPLTDPTKVGFYGRRDIYAFVRESLNAVQRNPILLYGQRRIGKTSILRQMPNYLNDVPVLRPEGMTKAPRLLDPFLDGQFLFGLVIELILPVFRLKEGPEASLNGQTHDLDGFVGVVAPTPLARGEDVEERRAIHGHAFARFFRQVAPMAGRGVNGSRLSSTQTRQAP